jgi:hypothetical protein
MSIISKLENDPEAEGTILNLMASGIPIENLVNTIALAGFGEGEFTPDTAEMIKLPLTMYLIGAAIENKIEAQVFNTSPENMREALEGAPDMIQDEQNELQEIAMDEQAEGFMRPPTEEQV